MLGVAILAPEMFIDVGNYRCAVGVLVKISFSGYTGFRAQSKCCISDDSDDGRFLLTDFFLSSASPNWFRGVGWVLNEVVFFFSRFPSIFLFSVNWKMAIL